MARLDHKASIALLRHHPVLVAGVIANVLLALGSFYLWQQIRTLDVVYQERSREGESLLATVASGSSLRHELTQVHEAARRLEDNLAIETSLAENLWYFYKIEEQTRVRLSELRQLNSPPAAADNPYKRIPYAVRVAGTYEQTATFLQNLETGPRLVKVTSFSFRRREQDSPSIALELNVDLLGKK